ncbi:MAG: hypothetical protein HQ518_03255 [Rhodopirellula sp.]|nr:hypothetical protein [Rhodopirellula sp.]
MTGYTVHTGTSKKFTEGWDNIFEKKKPAGKSAGQQKVDNVAEGAQSKSKGGGKKKSVKSKKK